MTTPADAWPVLPSVTEVRARLQRLFPAEFADRGRLVGVMAARVVYVFLYGGFVAGSGRLLRPSFVYFFTEAQANRTQPAQRERWLASAARPGFRPAGRRWYADNSRESIRDDLIRNHLLRLGIVQRAPGVPVTSSKPVYALTPDFAALFAPGLGTPDFDRAADAWRERRLDAGTLSRMRLRTRGLAVEHGDVVIDMPDATRIRVRAGPSSLILKAIIEDFAPRYLRQAAVLWISASDRKAWPEFVARAAEVGLRFSPSTELPDLILAEIDDRSTPRFVFCEVVATDGAVTAARRGALMAFVRASELPVERVEFLSAFEDREAPPFRRSFSSLAAEGMVWFRTEPELVVRLERLV